MRVLITTDVIGGVWDHTLTLIHELCREGVECFVAMIGEPMPEQIAALPDAAIHASRSLRLEWMKDAGPDVARGTAWLEDLAREWEPDLLHINQFAYAAGSFRAPRLVVAHSDACSWWSEVMDRGAPAEWDDYRRWVRTGLSAAEAVAAPTAYQSGLLARHYGRAADRVIANGIAPAQHRDPERPPSDRDHVFTAGRAWDRAKDVATLDKAVGLLGSEAPAVYLAGALDGPDGNHFRPRHLRSLGRITRPDMDRLYSDSAVYVATSLYEPFGLAPLEAAQRGCALLLADLGSFRGLWNGVAEFFPAGNARWLAEALRELLADPARMDELGARAKVRATERYSASTMADRYRDLYRSMTGAAESAVAAAGEAAS